MTFSKIGRIVTALVASGSNWTWHDGLRWRHHRIHVGHWRTYYNQISGFKIDDYTGNLTRHQLHSAVYSAGGTNPVSVLVRQAGGGRYVYVINAGTGANGWGVPNSSGFTGPGTGAGISQFAVGGDGILTFQQTIFQSQGFHCACVGDQWTPPATILYVLDKYSAVLQQRRTRSTNASGY